MCEEYGGRMRSLTALVDEIDAEAIDVRSEVRKAIELCLVLAPVVLVLPAVRELLHVPRLVPVPACSLLCWLLP